MLLNRFEYLLMNNPIRAALQRHLEAPQLVRMGGPVPDGPVLEVGCGRGVGVQVILDVARAAAVHAFDLDPRMVSQARRRVGDRRGAVHLWVGDASTIAVPSSTYDAVFDFGTLHHLPEWRQGLREIARVLKPGGRLYAEEVLAPFIRRTRWFLAHPQENRFDAPMFEAALAETGFGSIQSRRIGRLFAWFVATRASPGHHQDAHR